MRSDLFSLTILAVFIGVSCQARLPWESASFFRQEPLPQIKIAVIDPEIPEAEDHDATEDPDSLPPGFGVNQDQSRP
jgi:hypothetical protein